MTKLHQLHDRYGQSPWLDDLTRRDVTGGRLRRLAAQGIRGVTSNPTIIAKAVGGSTDYDGQLAALTAQGQDAEASYWSLVTDDLNGALAVLRPTYDDSGGGDGFVSVEPPRPLDTFPQTMLIDYIRVYTTAGPADRGSRPGDGGQRNRSASRPLCSPMP